MSTTHHFRADSLPECILETLSSSSLPVLISAWTRELALASPHLTPPLPKGMRMASPSAVWCYTGVGGCLWGGVFEGHFQKKNTHCGTVTECLSFQELTLDLSTLFW